MDGLITHEFPARDAEMAYNQIINRPNETLGVVIVWNRQFEPMVRSLPEPTEKVSRTVKVGLIGCGSFANAVILPNLQRIDTYHLRAIATRRSSTSRVAGRKWHPDKHSADYSEILADPGIDLVMIATRHDLHPVAAAAALRAGKHVFVEKPLAITEDGLADVLAAQRETGRIAMVGFNRRFAPLTRRALDFIGSPHGPLTISYRCNAGPMPPDHWIYDPEQGGGRIVGEACHFIDLVCCLAGSGPTSVYAQSIGGGRAEDNCFVTLRLSGGSVANVAYLAGGDKSFSKERVEVFGDGRVFVIEDFRTGLAVRDGHRETFKTPQDKGQADELRAVVDAIKNGGESPIPIEASVASSLASIRAVESLRSGMPVRLMGELSDE